MSVLSPLDSASMRINYTLPAQAGDQAKLTVKVKQASVSSAEALFAVEIEVMGKDGSSKVSIAGPFSFSTTHLGGPYSQTFSFEVPVSKLNEDGAGTSSRDEVFVRARKAPGQSAISLPSAWKDSNRVDAYFGIGEVTPET